MFPPPPQYSKTYTGQDIYSCPPLLGTLLGFTLG